jgi:tetratricopeptide (TPR) repeat protein
VKRRPESASPGRPARPAADAAHAEAARRLCAGEAAALPPDAADPLAVAWALKDACYAAWSSDPPLAQRAAAALQALARDDGSAPLLALADWTAGISGLIRSDMADALECLERASRRWLDIGEPLHAAHAQVPKLMALVVLGRFDDAQVQALATEAALLAEGDETAAARVRLNLGSVAYSRDEHAVAVEHYRAAAVRFARAGDREHSVMADIGLADALSYLGRLAEARRIYERARLRAEAHGLQVLAASAAYGSALLALAQGRYGPALAGLESTRRVFSSLGLEHRRAEAEKSLADAYLELRLLPEAVGLYEALAVLLREQGAGATLPWVQAQLAQALALQGRAADAEQRLGDAVAGFQQQSNPAGLATAWAVLAGLHLGARQPQRALPLVQQAQAAFTVAGLPAHALAVQVQALAVHTAMGDPSLALAQSQALLADGSLAPQLRVRALGEQAQALQALGRRDDARRTLEAVIEGVEELRAVLPGEDLQRAFLADASLPYAQRLQMALDDAGTGTDGAAAVLQWLERFKARALLERLGSSARPPLADGADEPLRERLDWIYRRQQRRVEDDGESPQALRAEAAALEQQLLEHARRERLLGGAAGGPAGASAAAALDVAALQAALGPERALVSYGIVGDELFAVVVRHDGVRLHRGLAGTAALGQAAAGLRFQVDAMRSAAGSQGRHLPMLCERAQRRLAQLHALVWQPLAADVAGHRHLFVVPHGVLHQLPFAALGDGSGALVDRHDLVMCASAAVALHALGAAAPGPAVDAAALLLGDSSRLPHVATELRAVATALAPGGVQVVEATGLAAPGLRATAARADVLHLACHADFRADSPMFSALHLADGALTVDQVQALALRARLVVLSACETALGDPGVADEGVGLVRAFLMAGARSVLGSRWAVDDAATAEFMALFYGHWRAGDGLAAALALAQRDLRSRRPHPAHWAAFALHGAP